MSGDLVVSTKSHQIALVVSYFACPHFYFQNTTALLLANIILF